MYKIYIYDVYIDMAEYTSRIHAFCALLSDVIERTHTYTHIHTHTHTDTQSHIETNPHTHPDPH